MLSSLRKWSIKSISFQVWSIHSVIAFTSVENVVMHSNKPCILQKLSIPKSHKKPGYVFFWVLLRFSIFNVAMEIRLRFFFFRQFATDSVIFHCNCRRKTREREKKMNRCSLSSVGNANADVQWKKRKMKLFFGVCKIFSSFFSKSTHSNGTRKLLARQSGNGRWNGN